MSLNQTTSEDRKYTAFVVDHLCKPLPCVLCGRYPEEGDKALEINTGQPRLLCSLCVATAMIGFEDLDCQNVDADDDVYRSGFDRYGSLE